jgi:hypothetical protein
VKSDKRMRKVAREARSLAEGVGAPIDEAARDRGSER